MKHTNKAVAATGIAFLLTGGVAAAALVPAASTASAVLVRDLGASVVDHGGLGSAGVMAAAATYIGISEADVRTALSAGQSLSDIAIANGKTRDGLIAALTQAVAAQIPQLVDTKGAPHHRGGPGGPGGFGVAGDPIHAAASYLGITSDELRAQLTSAQSLAAVANATSGKSRDGLIQALVNDGKAKIAQAQQDGRVTADQAAQLTAGLAERIARLVDSTGPRGRR